MNREKQRVLVIGAHPDDEVLGAGGTIAKHSRAGDDVYVAILTEGASVQFPNNPEMQTRKSSQAHQVADLLGVKNLFEGHFPDQRLDVLPILDVVQFLEEIIRTAEPNLIYTHHFAELNQDHRTCHEATTIAARPFNQPYLEKLLCFSVDSLVHLGQGPRQFNVYNDVSETLEMKIDAMKVYETELRDFPHPRSVEALRMSAAHNGAIVGLQAVEVFQSILEIRR